MRISDQKVLISSTEADKNVLTKLSLNLRRVNIEESRDLTGERLS